MKKLYGTTGKILRVDLSREKITEEDLDEAVLRKYVGGTAMGAKYLYDEVDPRIEWSDPRNIIYIGSGPLGGARIAGSSCFSIVAKGALNNGASSTQANGFFGAYLKFSGFDAIIVQGTSKDWKYLYIHDGVAELREARHLVGQNTWEIEDSLKKELGYSETGMSVFSIGPAGENLVKFSGVFGDRGHSASHNGVGAVFGSKKLKAMAVSRSSGKIEVANAEKISELSKKLNADFKEHIVYQWGTSKGFAGCLKTGELPVKNYTTSFFPEWEKFDGSYVRSHFERKNHPCWACPAPGHSGFLKVTEGPYTGYFGKDPEYEEWAAYGPQIGQTDPGAAVMLANEGDRLGFDCNEMGWIIGWVMECYQKGLLTAKELDGLEMTWGNVESTLALMRNVAHRKGFGAILAEGVKSAAEQVGGEAVNMAVSTMKPNTPRGHDHRARWVEMLSTCASSTGTVETLEPQIIDLTVYGLDKLWTQDRYSPQDVLNLEVKTKGSTQFADSLVACTWATRHNIPALTEVLNAATGWDMSFEEALRVGLRAINTMKMFNNKVGHTPEMDKPMPRYGSTPVDGPAKGISIGPLWDDMIKSYYQMMGWDEKTGEPTLKTLKELGLEYLLEK